MEVLNPAHSGNRPMNRSMNMAANRVDLAFDDASFDLLTAMTEKFGLGTHARTLREALRILHALQTHAEEGFSDVLVENPKTFDQRKLRIEFLERWAQAQVKS